MGVPAFFRWLSRKYPSVIAECIEQMPTDVDGVQIPVDSSQPNPNGIEFDNLYLDMNGIIHPCTHPEDKPAPKNEDEMMIAIFECVDRLFRIIRPRKVLYMAIDGVAPCAKMNQQRSRRFRASKETQEKIIEIARIRDELIEKGAQLPPAKSKDNHFDLNCITPGTEFMDRLSICLHYYVHDRLNNDPGWAGIKVILSDAKVPGEGEHKIMDYIRKQRAQPDHDPNTQHVLCGADADLIMLGLATHEPNFTIIREEFKPNKPRPCDICGQVGHEMKECVGIVMEDAGAPSTTIDVPVNDQYIFVRLNILREYLERELELPNLPFEYDFERALDDWVFMCFFVGNDFLPHLPSLEIREGAINRLVTLYKKTIYKTRGWLTDSGDVNLDSVQMIMSDLGQAEDEIFKRRQQSELVFKAREKAKKKREMQQKPNFSFVENTQFAPTPIGSGPTAVQNARKEIFKTRIAGMQSEVTSPINSQRALINTLMNPQNSNSNDNSDRRGMKRKFDNSRGENSEGKDNSDEEDDQAHDEVRLWEDGFKDRYYESKFDVSSDNLEFRYNVALQYVRGLCWVLRYYYQGCASWKWYFPYHYAPFASDFVNIGGLSTQFEKGTKPIRPLEQLMSVFPAASGKLVPKSWATLMSDPDSPIIDFYPEDFKIDLNGKKFAWQGVALLPFVEEKRLFKALTSYYDDLTPAESMRNSHAYDRVYVGIRNPSYLFIKNVYLEASNDGKTTTEPDIPYACQGVRGFISVASDCVVEGGKLNSPIPGLKHVSDNSVICAQYKDPSYPDDFIFPAIRLKGAIEPTRILKPGDLSQEENRNWRSTIGMVPSNTRATLGGAGHRMMGHHFPSNRMYGNVQPPSNLHESSNYHGGRGGRYDNSGRYEGRGRGSYRGGFEDRGGRYDSGYRHQDQRPRYGEDSRGGYDHNRQGRDGHSPRGRGGYSGASNHSGGYTSSRGARGGQDSARPNRDQRTHPYSRSEQNQWGYGQQKSQHGYQRR